MDNQYPYSPALRPPSDPAQPSGIVEPSGVVGSGQGVDPKTPSTQPAARTSPHELLPERAAATRYDPTDPRGAAIRSIRRKREFWNHLTAYVIVNALLVATWLVLAATARAWFFWPVFPIMGWGIGIAFHASAAFGRGNRPITETEIEAELDRLARR